MYINPALRDYLISAPGMIPVPLGLVQHLGRKEAYLMSYFIKANLQNGTLVKCCIDSNGNIIRNQRWSRVTISVLMTQILKGSLSTVERCLSDLTHRHLLFRARLNKLTWDSTKSYCVNFKAILPLITNYHINKVATNSSNITSNIGGLHNENY